MKIDKEYVIKAINGDRMALFNAFAWGRSPQGRAYWRSQWNGETPIDVGALKEMIGMDKNMLEVGKKYTSNNGGKEWECIFVRNGKAWMTRYDDAAYIWNAETGKSISLAIDSGHDIQVKERRNGSIEYVNGEPQFDTWREE